MMPLSSRLLAKRGRPRTRKEGRAAVVVLLSARETERERPHVPRIHSRQATATRKSAPPVLAQGDADRGGPVSFHDCPAIGQEIITSCCALITPVPGPHLNMRPQD